MVVPTTIYVSYHQPYKDANSFSFLLSATPPLFTIGALFSFFIHHYAHSLHWRLLEFCKASTCDSSPPSRYLQASIPAFQFHSTPLSLLRRHAYATAVYPRRGESNASPLLGGPCLKALCGEVSAALVIYTTITRLSYTFCTLAMPHFRTFSLHSAPSIQPALREAPETVPSSAM